MIRTCSADDEWVGDGDKRCGMKFDDAEKSTICPHPLLPGPVSREELDAMNKILKGNNQ